MTIQIIKKSDESIYFEGEEDGNLLQRARLQAELLTRDTDDEYEARVKPEET